MNDGLYDFRFHVLDREHVGTLEIRGNIADGGDERHVVHGQLSRAGSHIMASFDVDRADEPDTGYTIKMFGTGTESQFTLLGLAPLGLIVEFHGTWREALAPEVDEAA